MFGVHDMGHPNTAEEAHEQIDRALDADINFVDTAEMYPVNPVNAETIGRTERIIGLWFERDSRRSDMVLATKHSGEGMTHARDGAPISSKTIPEAIEGSLRRLKTDYIDLYQFHWPNRGSYMFRKNWSFDPSGQNRAETIAHMEDTLGALQKEVKRGTIRAFGLSNESAWGLTQWASVAERVGGPRPVSVQNEYSLLCRMADTDVSETCINEEIDMLAFSPLAAGLLTGKYQGGAVPDGSRMSLNAELGGRKTERAFDAVDAYLSLAQAYGLDPGADGAGVVQATAFHGFRSSLAQRIWTSLNALSGPGIWNLPDQVIRAIDDAHRSHPFPY